MPTNMARVSVAWSGWPGAPGVTQLYLATPVANTELNSIRGFFDGIKQGFPAGLTIQVPSSGDVISDWDGKLNGTWSAGPTPAPVVGTGTGGYAGNAGAVIHWLTSTQAKNRRLRGRTFLVPLVSSCYDDKGSILDGTVSLFTNSAGTLVSALSNLMLIWHRPVIQKGSGAVLVEGSSGPVTSARVPDLAVSLRSRRT